MKAILTSLLVFFGLSAAASAAVISFNLQGLGGIGLLPTNETSALAGNPGSGGEIGVGITFDTATNILTVIVGWGSGNGFTNLTGNAVAGHLHGPTASSGSAAFSEVAGVKYPIDSLAGWNPSATNGGFNGTINILPADVTGLLQGQFYMNVHTSTNGGGEIRGNLVVPEPASLGLCSLALLVAAKRRRRQ